MFLLRTGVKTCPFANGSLKNSTKLVEKLLILLNFFVSCLLFVVT
jgi:hypothetical protein